MRARLVCILTIRCVNKQRVAQSQVHPEVHKMVREEVADFRTKGGAWRAAVRVLEGQNLLSAACTLSYQVPLGFVVVNRLHAHSFY
jgi:hypothetical protein